MNQDTIIASTLLHENFFSYVFCNGEITIKQSAPGIASLLDLLKKGKDLTGFCVASNAVGKAEAFIYVKLGVKEVYAPIMTTAAIYTLAKHGIYPVCDRSVNSGSTNVHQMEAAVAEINDPDLAILRIYDMYEKMDR